LIKSTPAATTRTEEGQTTTKVDTSKGKTEEKGAIFNDLFPFMIKKS
jgi:hypothetical protein